MHIEREREACVHVCVHVSRHTHMPPGVKHAPTLDALRHFSPRGGEGRSLEEGPRNACLLLQCQQPLPQHPTAHPHGIQQNAGMAGTTKVTNFITLLENCQMSVPVWRSPCWRNLATACHEKKSSQASTGHRLPGAWPSCNGLVALGGQFLVSLLHHFQEAFLFQLFAGPLKLARVLTT